jgi:hypothetical protein
VLVTITEQLTNRQETKNAKETCWTPRKNLGDFGKILALFASLAVQKNNTQKENLPKSLSA